MKFEYTVTGKTVTEAYDKATALYASLGEIVESKVISEGKKGFLGIFGAQDAEIRVIVDDGKEEDDFCSFCFNFISPSHVDVFCQYCYII